MTTNIRAPRPCGALLLAFLLAAPALAEPLPGIEPITPLGGLDARGPALRAAAPVGLVQIAADRLREGAPASYFQPVAFDAAPTAEPAAWCEPGAEGVVHRARFGRAATRPHRLPPVPGRFGAPAMPVAVSGGCVACTDEIDPGLAALPTGKGDIGGLMPEEDDAPYAPALLTETIPAAAAALARAAVPAPGGSGPAGGGGLGGGGSSHGLTLASVGPDVPAWGGGPGKSKAKDAVPALRGKTPDPLGPFARTAPAPDAVRVPGDGRFGEDGAPRADVMAPIPLPTTAAFLGVALLGLGAFARRRGSGPARA